jgi:hypothetical protein
MNHRLHISLDNQGREYLDYPSFVDFQTCMK